MGKLPKRLQTKGYSKKTGHKVHKMLNRQKPLRERHAVYHLKGYKTKELTKKHKAKLRNNPQKHMKFLFS